MSLVQPHPVCLQSPQTLPCPTQELESGIGWEESEAPTEGSWGWLGFPIPFHTHPKLASSQMALKILKGAKDLSRPFTSPQSSEANEYMKRCLRSFVVRESQHSTEGGTGLQAQS
jgi:hypothetical protein